MCHINVEQRHKCKYMVMFPLKYLARKGLKNSALELYEIPFLEEIGCIYNDSIVKSHIN